MLFHNSFVISEQASCKSRMSNSSPRFGSAFAPSRFTGDCVTKNKGKGNWSNQLSISNSRNSLSFHFFFQFVNFLLWSTECNRVVLEIADQMFSVLGPSRAFTHAGAKFPARLRDLLRVICRKQVEKNRDRGGTGVDCRRLAVACWLSIIQISLSFVAICYLNVFRYFSLHFDV